MRVKPYDDFPKKIFVWRGEGANMIIKENIQYTPDQKFLRVR